MAKELSQTPSANYQRGYTRGQESMRVGRVVPLEEALQMALQRAKQAERGKFGPCVECARWARQTGCKWGFCLLSTDYSPVLGWSWRGDPGQRIATQETFGCVYFKPSEDENKKAETV
jgi:hypothetical protein